MKIIFVPIALLISILGCAQSKPVTSFSSYDGTIGDQSVRILLHRAGGELQGTYTFGSRGRPINVSGSDTSGANTLVLEGEPDQEGQATETIQLKITGTQLSGELNKGGKRYPVTASASAPDELALTLLFKQDSVALRPQLKETPMHRSLRMLVWPTDPGITASFVRNTVAREMDLKGIGNASPDPLPAVQWKQLTTDYRNSYKDESDKEISESSYRFNEDDTRELRVFFRNERLLNLEIFNYNYSGGAHGMYSTHYLPMDLKNRKELELADVVTPAGKTALNKLLEAELRETMNLNATEPLTNAGLFDNFIRPNENFYVTDKGIGFSYSPYEIAAYAMGEIRLFVPFTSLKGMLKPAFIN